MYKHLLKLSTIFFLSVAFAGFSASAAVSIIDSTIVINIPDYNLTAENLIDVTPSDENNSSYIAHYRAKITPNIYFRGTGYLNGHFKFYVTTSIDNPNNTTFPHAFLSMHIEGDTIINDNMYTTVTYNTGVNNGSYYCFGAFNDFYVESSQNVVPFPAFYIDIFLNTDGTQTENIGLSFTSSDIASTLSYSETPNGNGLAETISSAVVDALGDWSETGSAINYLDQLLLNTDRIINYQSGGESLLTEIKAILNSTYSSVDGVESLLSSINSYLSNIDNTIDTITWLTNYGLSFDGYSETLTGEYSTNDITSYIYKCLYFKVTPNTRLGYFNNIISFNLGIFATLNYTIPKDRISVILYDGERGFSTDIDFYFIRQQYSYKFYILCPYISDFSSNTKSIKIKIDLLGVNSYIRYNSSYNTYNGYLPDTDIEYWNLLNNLTTLEMKNMMENIANLSPSDEAKASAIASEYSEKASLSNDLANNMTPSYHNFSNGDFNIDTNLDTTQKNNFNGLMATILSNGLITKLFVITIIIATISFALYGKKG